MLGFDTLTKGSKLEGGLQVSGSCAKGSLITASAQCGVVFVFKGHPVAFFNGTKLNTEQTWTN